MMVNDQIYCYTHYLSDWVRQIPHTTAENILYRCRLNPMFSIGLYVLTWTTYQKRCSQTKCNLYLKDNSFCINISCISHQLVAKPLLFIHFYMNHLNIYNLTKDFLDSFSLTVILFVKRIIARSDFVSFMPVKNPHNVKVSCAVQDTAA